MTTARIHLVGWASLALLAGLLSWLILRAGYIEYNADGFTRTIHGYEWLQAPRWEVDVWLPLQTWLVGLALKLHGDLLLMPRLINIIFTGLTLANLYAIGVVIGDRRSAMLGVACAIAFPLTLWLGLSGMAEPLFNALLSAGVLGLLHWTRSGSTRGLALGNLALLGSTMVRYEGWFFAAIVLPLVALIAWRSGRLNWKTLALAGVPMLFPLLWMQQHWQVHGDPLWFARATSSIKDFETAGEQGGLLERLTFYPQAMFYFAPLLVGLALVCAVVVCIRRTPAWPLVMLVAAQAALLIGVTSLFSSLGPGAERYLVANTLLLFPVVGVALRQLPTGWLRIGGLALVALCLIPAALETAKPPTDFPDHDTREVAEVSRAMLDGPAGSNQRIPTLALKHDAYLNVALPMLTNHPEPWLVTTDPFLFSEWVRTIEPRIWVLDGELDTLPNADRTQQIGRMTVGWNDSRLLLAFTDNPGDTLRFEAAGLAPGEPTAAWLTDSTGHSLPLEWSANAHEDGTLSGNIPRPADISTGTWTLVLTGIDSDRTGTVPFEVTNAQP